MLAVLQKIERWAREDADRVGVEAATSNGTLNAVGEAQLQVLDMIQDNLGRSTTLGIVQSEA